VRSFPACFEVIKKDIITVPLFVFCKKLRGWILIFFFFFRAMIAASSRKNVDGVAGAC
jgi:hypothetical protein